MLVLGAPALAQQQNSTAVNGGAVTGNAGVNAASGTNNQEANAGLISIGRSALSTGSVGQSMANAPSASGADSATIADGAFANSNGLLSINGVAGNDNQAANVAAIATGIEANALGDALLTQSRASTKPTVGSATPSAVPDRSAVIGDGAFGNSQGVVQVNLIGGDGNTSANTFALSVSGPASQ